MKLGFIMSGRNLRHPKVGLARFVGGNSHIPLYVSEHVWRKTSVFFTFPQKICLLAEEGLRMIVLREGLWLEIFSSNF